MQWFYSQLDVVYVNSEHYRHRWIERGIAPERLKIFPRGIDTTLFTPANRNPGFWAKYGRNWLVIRRTYFKREKYRCRRGGGPKTHWRRFSCPAFAGGRWPLPA